MLKTLTDIIASLGLIDGKVSVMTADQLDEFARNIPDKKISCNVFGIGGYSRNDADVLTKTVRICLLKQMPVNYDLSTVDLAEAEMSTKLLAIMDALGDSPFINAENQTAITPELLTYDRTTLLVYLDVDLFGNASDCGGSPCIPEFFNNYVTEKFAEINESVDAAEAAAANAKASELAAEEDRQYLETELFHYISDDETSVRVGMGTQVFVEENTEGYPSIIIKLSVA